MKIKSDPRFKRDYKKLKKDHYPVTEIDIILRKMSSDQPLREYYDHALTGNMQGFRELHVDRKKKSNWLLLYGIVGDTAHIYKTGTHDYITGK